MSRRLGTPAETDAPGVLLDWDSAFWGVAVARLDSGTMTPAIAARADDWVRDRGVECLYFLADSGDPATAHAAEAAGFRLVDVRVELAREPGPTPVPEAIRSVRSGDIAELEVIARRSHELTRFYADPHFPRQRCDELYELWIRRSCEGWADETLVADEDGTPVGYVSLHAEPAARIGLIAVDDRARRRGHGRGLVDSAVGWANGRGSAEISVVTQGRNVAALRLFEECGFRTRAVDLWFHKWYGR